MVNVNKLRGKVVEAGLSMDDLAKNIGMNRSTLYRKLENSGETFLLREADSIVNALKLSKEEVNAIFFSQFVA